MVIRLLLIQLCFSAYWLVFVTSGLDPITLPLVAAFALMPLIGVLGTAQISPVKIIPILVLFTVGYLAWLYGWEPTGPGFAWVTGLVALIAWNGCTQVAEQTRMNTIWLGVMLFCPLFIMVAAAMLNIHNAWPPTLSIAIQSGALVFAIRSDWPARTAITDITLLRMNGLAMLMLPVIFITDNNAVFGVNEHILGLGGAVSAIVMTRQHLRFRRHLLAANRELADYTYRDQLTGIYTWAGMKARLKANPMPQMTMVCVDIDQFGQFNARAGFDVGDQLLRHIGQSLETAIPHATHARIGGDIFVAVVGEGSTDPADFEATYQDIIKAFDADLDVTITAGVSSPGTLKDVDDLLCQCDASIAQRRAAKLITCSPITRGHTTITK